MKLSASHLTLAYREGDAISYAVHDISIQLPERGFVGIMGPSGSGKSSLLYLLSGLKPPTEGEVSLDYVSLTRLSEQERAKIRRERFGFVFQQPFLLNHLTARENVMVSALRHKGLDAEVNALFTGLSIDHLASRFPTHLSGGERQRIAVARAMAHQPEIIFADEPTAALDHTNGRAVIELLASYRERGLLLLVTHDPTMLEEADFIYKMEDGRIRE